jgi:hypothetical protein
MSLILPTVGQEPGPNWALDLNSSLSLVDQHNHASGSGVQITPAGINIDVDLPFNGSNATGLRSTRFDVQVSPLSGGLDIGCIYVSGQDLYYNDTLGNQVQLTASGAVNGTPGSIGNLIAPAAATYVPANQTFVFQSNQTNATPAALDGGPVLIRNITAASNYIRLQANPILPGNYSITLPSVLPASNSVLLLDNLGNVSTSLALTINSLSSTSISSTSASTSTLSASSSISIKNDNGLLEFKNTADSVQFASITGSSSGLTLNLPDTTDSYTFKVNGVTKAVINNNGIEQQPFFFAWDASVSVNNIPIGTTRVLKSTTFTITKPGTFLVIVGPGPSINTSSNGVNCNAFSLNISASSNLSLRFVIEKNGTRYQDGFWTATQRAIFTVPAYNNWTFNFETLFYTVTLPEAGTYNLFSEVFNGDQNYDVALNNIGFKLWSG